MAQEEIYDFCAKEGCEEELKQYLDEHISQGNYEFRLGVFSASLTNDQKEGLLELVEVISPRSEDPIIELPPLCVEDPPFN